MNTPDRTYIDKAYKAWADGADLRLRRSRYKRYTYGDQWSDPVADLRGRCRTEREMIESTGRRPMTNNLIRQLVKTVVGRFRSDAADKGSYTQQNIREIARRNSLGELDARLMEEFLISGCAVQRIANERRFDGCGVWIDNISPDRFFVNRYNDPRGCDIHTIGMLHDMTLPEIINRFARDNAARAASLRRSFAGSEVAAGLALGAGADAVDFFTADRDEARRVVELWTFETGTEHTSAPRHEFTWHCRWMAPDGEILDEYDSPFPHRSHPFVVRLYPLTDGEVHSFVEDVIDQQRCINRLIVLIDHILATSAKGVLLYPIDQLPAGVTLEDVAERWAQVEGVIPLTGRGSQMPAQVMTNSANPGAYQLLQLQLKLFQDISGVSEALSGRTPSAASGAELYDAQIRNATIALADLFETFAAFTAARDSKARLSR